MSELNAAETLMRLALFTDSPAVMAFALRRMQVLNLDPVQTLNLMVDISELSAGDGVDEALRDLLDRG
ncbi:hypothetical protein [Micromonospora maritima]|uniref:hypothetical protein n=1 Tax=Micromonospora maritima TaxID=986711 RepID=UPI00157C23DB|nr:hypothetical protein [Micromonospora maritima]